MGVRCVRGLDWRTYFVEISVYLESRSRYPTWGSSQWMGQGREIKETDIIMESENEKKRLGVIYGY